MRKKIIAILLASIAMIASVYYILQLKQSEEMLVFPETLGEMVLYSSKSGYDAVKEISRIHRASDNVRMKNGYIAIYKSHRGEMAYFWISEEDNADAANKSLMLMTTKIREDRGMFASPIEAELGKQFSIVYYTEGLHQYHYFYAKQNRVFWIAMNNPNISEQLNIVQEAIERIG